MLRLTKSGLAELRTSYGTILHLTSAAVRTMAPKLKCRGAECGSNCCSRDLTITETEYNYLRPHVGEVDYHSGNCPLLINGRCSVYNYRPIECRLYNRIDSVVGLGCNDIRKLGDEYLVVRELIYRLLWEVNGSAEERHLVDWLKGVDDDSRV